MDTLEQFTEELHQWSLTGKEPASASIDLRYMLNLQEARLKEQNILREEEYVHVKDEIRGSLSRKGNGYTSKIIYREARQNLTYRRGDKVLRKYSRPVNLYVSVLDREDASREEQGLLRSRYWTLRAPSISRRTSCRFITIMFDPRFFRTELQDRVILSQYYHDSVYNSRKEEYCAKNAEGYLLENVAVFLILRISIFRERSRCFVYQRR